jgi:hypothetical protein
MNLLGNIVALPEPIPAKGRQQLWEWTSPAHYAGAVS